MLLVNLEALQQIYKPHVLVISCKRIIILYIRQTDLVVFDRFKWHNILVLSDVTNPVNRLWLYARLHKCNLNNLLGGKDRCVWFLLAWFHLMMMYVDFRRLWTLCLLSWRQEWKNLKTYWIKWTSKYMFII